ncbi:MAG: gluconate 2-dehydrogenase subunit 3 family protein [Litorimonas sp.]
MTNLTMNRRTAITSLLAISTAGALAACGPPERVVAASEDGLDMDYASVTKFFSVSEMAFLSALAQTIMPQTETAGAVEAGVPDVLQDLASVWGDSTYRRYWREGIASLGATFKTSSGQDFAALSPTLRANTLKPFDADVYDGKITNQFYRDAKSTILQAYYKSEPGASEELAYEPIPGEWIGCAPLSEFPKTWAV